MEASTKSATIVRTARLSPRRNAGRAHCQATIASITVASTMYGSGANMEKLTKRATGMRWISSTMNAHASPTMARMTPGVSRKNR